MENRWEPHIRKYEENTPQVQYKLFCEIEKEMEGVRKCHKFQPMWDNLDYLARSLPILCIVAWSIILVISLASKTNAPTQGSRRRRIKAAVSVQSPRPPRLSPHVRLYEEAMGGLEQTMKLESLFSLAIALSTAFFNDAKSV